MNPLHRRHAFFHEVLRVASNPTAIQEIHPDPDVPPDVMTFLADLSLLRGVPFQYLVPDSRMLISESIRFFYVDPNWVRAAMEGAYSIARSTDSDLAHDQALWQDVYQEATAGRATTITGFLLRSAAVSGWPDLQVDAYPVNGAGDDQRLPVLRKETLAADILLCLFGGELKQVAIHKPAEVLHFGVEIEGLSATGFVKSLKSLTVNPGSDVQVQAPGVFRPGGQRVIDIAGLKRSIQSHLTTYSGPFTAAEFSLEMVEEVERVYFNVTEQAR